MSTIRPEFHSNIISQLLSDIFYQRSSWYHFLGKIAPWESEDNPPESPGNSSLEDMTIRDNILYLKRVTPNDVSLVTTSYKWNSGTVYDHWDDRIDMKNKAFYVVTSDYNVYKCLDNNNGAVSTVMPTSQSLFPFKTTDGYLWKYMYNIPNFKRQKFLSRGYLPVQKALTDTFYSRGAIESVVVTDPGSGYSDVPQTQISIIGATTGADASVEITEVGLLGEITAEGLSIVNGGTGYTEGAIVTITSLTGVNAKITPVIEDGVITGFDVVSAGSGYTTNDMVTVSVGGAVLIPSISRATGEITKVIVKNPGAGYTEPPTLTIEQLPATGTGKYGNPTAILKPIMYNGSIVNVTVEDPGVNYPTDTATTIVVTGDGENAEFTPVIYEGELVDVIVDNPGVGYSYMTITIVGAGTGAKAEAVIAASDFLSDQSQVEQVNVVGAIYSIVVTNPGNNYSAESTITIIGDGSGATGYPVVVDGQITQIVMNSYGSNYTFANIIVNDPNRVEPNNFTNLEAYAVFPPTNGHGYDAVNELYADTICVYSLIKGDVELNLIAQDYRQYGLLYNPVDLITNRRITSSANFVTFVVTVNDVFSMAPDDILVCDNKRYRVVYINGTQVTLQQLNSIYAQPSGVFYDENDPSVQYIIEKIISTPNVNKYSGDLLYTTNNTPFTPTGEQTIAIRTYIKI